MVIGWNGTEIKFDGVDDYLEVYSDFEMSEGLTFEFYGKSNEDINMLAKTVKHSDGWSNRFRTCFLKIGNQFRCCVSAFDSKSDWSIENMKHWIRKENLEEFNNESGSYITMTLNLDKNEITLYQNGNIIGSTLCSAEWLRNGGLTDNSIPFTVGMQVGGQTYTESYSQMSLYTCRLYNRVLTNTEVKNNYNQTVAYHNMSVNQTKYEQSTIEK